MVTLHLIQHSGWSGSNARSFTSTTPTQLASSLSEFERKNTAPNPNPNKITSSLFSSLYLSILWIYLIEGSSPMKSPAPGQNSICDFSGPTIGNHKGLTCSLTGKKLPFPHLACGQAVNYSLWRELQSRAWVLLASLAHMHICILSLDIFSWSPFYLGTEQRPSCFEILFREGIKGKPKFSFLHSESELSTSPLLVFSPHHPRIIPPQGPSPQQTSTHLYCLPPLTSMPFLTGNESRKEQDKLVLSLVEMLIILLR